WRDPQGLAWALPPLPWALAAASVALAGARLLRARGQTFVAAEGPQPPLSAMRERGGGHDRPLSPQRGRGGEGWVAAGLLGLGAGVGLMHTQVSVVAGAGLAVVGLLALTAAPGGLGASVWDAPAWDLGRRRALLALGAIFLLALALRLFRLDQLPFGLWRDEARHGLVALHIAEDPSYRPVYVLDLRVHLPGLGLYPFAVALRLFGVHLWTLRAATALAGALTVLPLYAVAARLSGRRAVGLAAALLLAASSWHISISRLAFPTVFEPLLSLSAWVLIFIALAPSPAPGEGERTPTLRRLPGGGGLRRPLAALLAGILLGAAAQTYHTGRVTPLAAGWLCLLLLGLDRRAWRPWLACMGALALGFALTTAPLVAYALARPGDFNDRVGEVFLLGEAALRGRAPLGALDANLGRHLLMFTAEGDANGRHHAPLRPLLDIVTGAGLLLGLAALLRSLRDWRSRFVLGALAVGLLPGLLAVDAPHAMRTFGAVAPACLIAALGWGEALRLARAAPAPSAALGGALALLVAAVVGLNAWLYFGVMPGDPRVFTGFYPVQSRMGVYVREAGGRETIFVPREVRDHPSFAFLAAGLPVGAFEAEAGPGQGRL
ncbi:MAG: hypothetical protein HGA45_43775, partial [Chloroflexales bacterium]|nr:hypothetical protein [Chloroflexales bacterium]